MGFIKNIITQALGYYGGHRITRGQRYTEYKQRIRMENLIHDSDLSDLTLKEQLQVLDDRHDTRTTKPGHMRRYYDY